MLKVPTPRLLSSLNDFCWVVTGFRGSDFTATEFLSCIMAACNSSSGDTGSSLSASSPGAKVASAIKVVKEIRLDLYLIRKCCIKKISNEPKYSGRHKQRNSAKYLHAYSSLNYLLQRLVYFCFAKKNLF